MYQQETKTLPPIAFTAPATFAQAQRTGASTVGNSAIGAWLSCPQYSHLSSLGVQPKPYEGVSDYGLNALSLGTLFHLLRAARLVHGQAFAEDLLRRFSQETREVGADDAMKVLLWLRVYDQEFPLPTEPFEVLGVEVEVVTNIKDWWGRPLFRTVRYDTVIRLDGAIFSLECKTTAKSGQAALNQYIPQGMVHSALWNANAALVEQYGAMQGTIWDTLVKTAEPKAARIGPRYFTTRQQEKALDYLRLPEVISVPRLPDGSYPRFFHNCWGKYAPCRFIAGCHDDVWGDYEIMNKQTGESVPYFPEAA